MHRFKPVITAFAVFAFALAFGVQGRAYSTFGKWASSPVSFYMNPQNKDVTVDAAEAAFKSAIDTWNTEGSSSFRYNYAGRVGDTATAYDGRNVAIFRADGDGSEIARTYSWSSGGAIVDADIIFWDGPFTFFTGSDGCVSTPSYGVYVEDVATHELGHALGLLHSAVADATMVSGYPACSTWKRSLDPDDISAVQSLYGSSSPNTPATAPTLSIVSPANNTSSTFGSAVTFSATASDKEDGNLSSSVTWTSSIDGLLGTGASFNRTLSAGAHSITASVADSGGLTASKQTSVTVTQPLNTTPTVTVSSPTITSVNEGVSVSFIGSASDNQDGNLTSRMVWTSNVLGQIGVGGSFSRSLTAGTHVITASATDNAGATASKQLTLSVSASLQAPTVQPTLTASGYKVKGAQRVDLTWSGFSTTNVDVYRNGSKIVVTANDGYQTDNINAKGGGTYKYRLCASGSSTCSVETVVAF